MQKEEPPPPKGKKPIQVSLTKERSSKTCKKTKQKTKVQRRRASSKTRSEVRWSGKDIIYCLVKWNQSMKL